MDNDNGEGGEGVVVPLSLIKIISESMLSAIDAWHEQRGIQCLNAEHCVVAMLAALDAVTETLHTYPDEMTLQ